MQQGGSHDLDAWEAVYRLHFPLLTNVAIRKFGVPPEEAEALAQDVLLSYVHAAASVQNIRAWLIGAVCNASRHYWRSERRVGPGTRCVEENDAPFEENHDSRIAAAQILESISGKQREAVRLRYIQGCSMAEIAERLGTSTMYAEKLVRVGLKNGRVRLGE